MTDDPGVFTISLDTELAWGSFDKGGIERFGEAYRKTPAIVEELCDLFDRHGLSATWAFVAHLFDECAGHDDVERPERAAWLTDAPCSMDIERSLWYAPEMLETVQRCSTPQEVGLHGYSHLRFDQFSRQAVKTELEDAQRVADERGFDPSAFVFPRNGIGHLDLLAEAGLTVARGRDARWFERPGFGPGRKPLRFLDELAGLTPPTVTPTEREGVVVVPGSQVFRPDTGPWAMTPTGRPEQRAKKGLDRAAETGQLFHLWFHPFNMANDVDHHLSMLDGILSRAGELRRQGRLEVLTLSEVARAHRNGRWAENGTGGGQ